MSCSKNPSAFTSSVLPYVTLRGALCDRLCAKSCEGGGCIHDGEREIPARGVQNDYGFLTIAYVSELARGHKIGKESIPMEDTTDVVYPYHSHTKYYHETVQHIKGTKFTRKSTKNGHDGQKEDKKRNKKTDKNVSFPREVHTEGGT